MKETKNIVVYVLFFGAIWGILEATLGFGLQFLPPLVSGSVMFPIASTILYLTFKNTNSKRAMFYVAFIAASIKAINLFMPGLPAPKTYNPMIAIMLQSLVMVSVISFLNNKSLVSKAIGLLTASLAWRALFLVNFAIAFALTGRQPRLLSSTTSMIEFVLYLGLMETMFLSVIHLVILPARQKSSWVFKPNLVLSVSTLALAVLLNVGLIIL